MELRETLVVLRKEHGDAKLDEALREVRAETTGETRRDLRQAAPEALVERVSWAKAVKLCPRLAQDHKAAMRAALQQGLPELLGMDAAAYANQFKIALPKTEVEAIRDDKNSVGLYTPHFENASKALEVLIKQAGIPLWQGTHGLEHIGELRRADSRDMPTEELAALRGMKTSDERTRRAYALFQGARGAAEGRPYSPASVLYVADQQEAPVVNKSALDVIGKGSFLNGAAQFMFIRQALDIGMAKELGFKNLDDLSPQEYQTKFAELFQLGSIFKYMPDIRGWIECPNDVFANGDVLLSSWAPAYRRLNVDGEDPVLAAVRLGFRPARGGFASQA